MIIGISGRMGSGKNTVGDIIEKICLTNEGPLFEQKSFAGKLKQIASLLTGIPVEKFEDQEFKKSLLGDEWGVVKDNPLNAIPVFEDVQFNHLMSVREFLQKLGTEAMRDGLHTNVWVNALFADYRPQPNKAVAEFLAAEGLPQSMNAGEENYPNWIITDMRFPNELEAVVEKGGITIRVSRTGIHTPKVEDLHPSETSLDDVEFNYHIDNSGTIEDLIEKVEEILIKSGVI
jgi:hypothetical protein